jgi:hypothetical protein
MALQCNIDRRGKLLRMVYGLTLAIAGIAMMFFWARHRDSVFPWILSSAITLGGAFAIFESLVGWCVVRALGYKTSI